MTKEPAAGEGRVASTSFALDETAVDPTLAETAPLPSDQLPDRRVPARDPSTTGPVPGMKQTLPAARDSRSGRLTRLDHYAQLAAELRAIPDEADRILAKFGLRSGEERQQ